MLGVDRLLNHQAGVISRRQVLAAGGTDAWIERMLRSRRWRGVHPGVYVHHTGALSRVQQAWAAVLYAAPAALAGESALHAHGVRGHDTTDPVRVVVSHHRRVRAREGIRVERVVDFDRVAQLGLSPPRVRLEHALLRVASNARSADRAVAVLSDGVQSGRTTADRLASELAFLPRLKQRGLLQQVLADVVAGSMSALESRYLRDVERAHGLPIGERQLAESTDKGVVRRDVVYPDQKALLELDGRLGHDAANDRWDDLDRDIASAVSGRVTLRAGWRQVLEPCRTAMAVAAVLRARGWTGSPRPCGPGCRVS